jgi:hypothetical protein
MAAAGEESAVALEAESQPNRWKHPRPNWQLKRPMPSGGGGARGPAGAWAAAVGDGNRRSGRSRGTA